MGWGGRSGMGGMTGRLGLGLLNMVRSRAEPPTH